MLFGCLNGSQMILSSCSSAWSFQCCCSGIMKYICPILHNLCRSLETWSWLPQKLPAVCVFLAICCVISFCVLFRLVYLVQSQLVLVRRRLDCLVSRVVQAVQAFLSLRHSHSRLLEAAYLVQKQQRLQASEASEQLEPLALVRHSFHCYTRHICWYISYDIILSCSSLSCFCFLNK